jgi:hypothetical protein
MICIAVTVALLIGLLYGFFIAIICGQNISNRHYHILAKQELTKVHAPVLIAIPGIDLVCLLIQCLESLEWMARPFYVNVIEVYLGGLMATMTYTSIVPAGVCCGESQ